MSALSRCPTASGWLAYHDEVWGKPIQDSSTLFEMLSLCSQQAGLNWRTIWTKRHAYRNAFHNFNMDKVAAMNDEDVLALIEKHQRMRNEGVDKSALILCSAPKLRAIVHNAKLCAQIEQEHEGGLHGFLWGFMPNSETIVNAEEYETFSQLEEREGEDGTFGKNSRFSKALEKELKHKRGFKYLGSITLQAFLLQNGLLNGHCPSCFCNSFKDASPSTVADALTHQKEARAQTPEIGVLLKKKGKGKGKRVAKAKAAAAAGNGICEEAPESGVAGPAQWQRKKLRQI
jgi:DNA-3-methyladenine glycosylase I